MWKHIFTRRAFPFHHLTLSLSESLIIMGGGKPAVFNVEHREMREPHGHLTTSRSTPARLLLAERVAVH
jgi:hypothetical protein